MLQTCKKNHRFPYKKCAKVDFSLTKLVVLIVICWLSAIGSRLTTFKFQLTAFNNHFLLLTADCQTLTTYMQMFAKKIVRIAFFFNQ